MIQTKTYKTWIVGILAPLSLLTLTASAHFDALDVHFGKEKDTNLHATMLALDKLFFDAYNNCDMETQATLISEDLEFYHDQGGLATSKQEILESIEKNICGKVTRTLVSGSLEVSPIPGYGAAVVGLHQFRNHAEPEGTPSKKSRFVAIWKQTGDQWQMTRIISLH
ncbi:MAG: nuclear transport factor 2 family protein [Flavobacteriaceae bacterium]